MKHTPGPWKVVGSEIWGPKVRIVTGRGAYDEKDRGRNIANARLIAAAPDMLEGHIDILRIIKGVEIRTLTYETAIGMIKILSETRIERATGERPTDGKE